MKKIFCILFLTSFARWEAATPMRTMQICTLEDGSEATLQAQFDPERDADRFYVTLDGKTDRAFADMPDTAYAGQLILSKCLNHVLVFAISYGAPYYKGGVIRRNTDSRTTHRIDFSEKALPELLYLGKRETKLLIPNLGHEVSSKYLLYRFNVEQGQPEEAGGIDVPPPEAGFDVIRVGP